MDEILKLKYKVGEIEFEAEGPAEIVEQHRIKFMESVLPAAVNAMVQTHGISENKTYIEASPLGLLPEGDPTEVPETSCNMSSSMDYSRVNLSSFLKKYGQLSHTDFTLFAAYFDEIKNKTEAFSIKNVEQYYEEARRQKCSNISDILIKLVKKGYIMDTNRPENEKSGKYYKLTDEGITYINGYKPKEDSGEKKRSRPKPKKVSHHISEAYASLTADDLNLSNYPQIASLSGPKKQVIMVMFIVTNEKKGEWFTVDDLIHLFTYIFETKADIKMITGVFDRNKSMFASEQDPNNKKAYRRKLLSSAKDFASSIIQSDQK